MFKKKVSDERRYKVDFLGSLNVTKTTLPHSLTTETGEHYEIRTLTFDLRVGERGPILFTRTYAIGDRRSMQAMQYMIKFDLEVDNEVAAEDKFYRSLVYNWNN